MMYGRRRSGSTLVGWVALISACVGSPADERDAERAEASDGRGEAQSLVDAVQLAADGPPLVPDASLSCAPALSASACVGLVGRTLASDFNAVYFGEVSAIGLATAERCDFTARAYSRSGEIAESVAFQVRVPDGTTLDVRVNAQGLDAYLAAHPLVLGEPVRLDLGRQSGHFFEDGGSKDEADGFRWVRDQRVAVAIVTWREVAGVSVVPTRAFGEPVELAISNVSYLSYEDGGGCHERSGPLATAVARP